jgi:hypothetical protein
MGLDVCCVVVQLFVSLLFVCGVSPVRGELASRVPGFGLDVQLQCGAAFAA